MLFVEALKEGVVGPDLDDDYYTFKNGESRLIKESQKGWYEEHPDAFRLTETLSFNDGSSSNSGIYGVSTRLRLPNFFQAGCQFLDSWEVHVATDWIREPWLLFVNGTGTGEDGAAGSVNIDMSFMFPIGGDENIMPAVSGVFCPQNGNVKVKSAKLARPIPPGAAYLTRTNRVGSAPGGYPVMRDGLQARFGAVSGDNCSYGTTAGAVPNTVLGGVPGIQGNATGFTYGPSIIADFTSNKVPFLMGDSRNQAAFSFDGNLDTYGLQGAIVRSLPGLCVINGSVSGDSFFNIQAIGGGGKKYDNRLAMAEYANVIICTLGINDPLLDVPLYQTYTQAAKALFGNKPFLIDTFYDFTSSTNLWRDLASQTQVRPNLNALNLAIRTGQIGRWIDGNFDSAAGMDGVVGGGLMRIDGQREVNDGVVGSAFTGSNAIVRSATANFTQADLNKSLIAYRKIPFTSASWASNQVTLGATGHGMTVGSTFSGLVADSNQPGHNTPSSVPNLHVVFTVVDADTIRYNRTTNPGAIATSGNIYFLLLGSLSTSASAAPSATIKSVDSPTQVTLTNMTGGFFGTTGRNGDACLIIGRLHQDGLHAFPLGDVEIAKGNEKTTAARFLATK